MSNPNQPRQETNKSGELFLLLVGMAIAWPALLLAAFTRWYMKQQPQPFPYWIGMGILGALGVVLLLTRENPYPFLVAVLNDISPLVLHLNKGTIMHILSDALPLWARSTLAFPCCTFLLEFFGTRSLQTTLLARERQRRAAQAKKSQHAARKATRAPEQIKGKAVLGALIDDPNT